jgi:TonB family protein
VALDLAILTRSFLRCNRHLKIFVVFSLRTEQRGHPVIQPVELELLRRNLYGPAWAITVVLASFLSPTSSMGQAVPASSIDLPVLGSVVPIKYPVEARVEKAEGTVVIKVLVSETGWTEKIELKQTSGYASLDRAAMQTAKSWRYQPGKRDGKPTAMWVDVPIVFKAQPPEPNPPATKPQ